MIADGGPYDPAIDFGDLEHPRIGNSVSVLGELTTAQMAAEIWWAKTAEGARNSGADILVLNGRNPRQRLSGIDMDLALELVVECDVEEAGRREAFKKAKRQGLEAPSLDMIRLEVQGIADRRRRDRNREDNPYAAPAFMLPFILGESSAQMIVDTSWTSGCTRFELPHPIGFDNTTMPMEDMKASAAQLAITALALGPHR